MKKEEKTKLTVQRILDAGLEEFGKGTYETVSINAILENHGISKGLFYHNFASKDELYIAVVKKTFDEMIKINDREVEENGTNINSTRSILQRRHTFFKQNPLMANIFFTAVFKTPPHLSDKVKEAGKAFQETSKRFIMSLPIKDDIDPALAADCVLFIQEIFNLYYINETRTIDDFRKIVEDHEKILESLINILFHGILKE